MKLVVKKKMVDTVGKTNTYKVIVEFNGKDKEVIVDKKRYFRSEVGGSINIGRNEKMASLASK